MPDIDQQIRQITWKLQQLLKNHAQLQRENDKLKNELEILKLREKEKDERLQLLTLRNDVLKVSKSNLTDEDKKQMEKTINQYLREIDKCIAFLNE